MDVVNLDRVEPFITKDGSEIRELLAHRNSCIRNQTLAEARLPVGARTAPHRHVLTEEIYYVLEGRGRIRVGGEERDVGPGDAIAIPPGAVHAIANTGPATLRFLCCCAPGYEHDDTVLVDVAVSDIEI
ncbi:MAG: cupin domain-containing protein [Pirellulales bacterium]|nr:cupin domain-containing protein [Pirellulales bacterium]